MKRILTPAPATYHLNKLSAAIQAQIPEVICINEVTTDRKYIAVYCEDSVTLNEQALAAIVLAHDPTPPTPQPTLEQRLAEALERIAVLEQAQATLGAEVGKVTALGAMSQPIE